EVPPRDARGRDRPIALRAGGRTQMVERFLEPDRRVREAEERLPAHPVGPQHEPHAAADRGLRRDLDRDARGARGPSEDGRAAETGREVRGQPLEVAMAGPARIPAGQPRPPVLAAEALEGLLVARPELVVEVPAFEAGGQLRPQAFGPGQAVHLVEDEVERGAVAAVALLQARDRGLQHVVIALDAFGRRRTAPGLTRASFGARA